MKSINDFCSVWRRSRFDFSVTVTNHGDQEANLRWIEYWGCHNYQFSYRSWMQATVLNPRMAPQLRRQFGARFAHDFRAMPNRAGLIETQKFLGRTPEEMELWEQVEAYAEEGSLRLFWRTCARSRAGAAMEDLNPPTTFLVSLDAPVDGFATDASAFFGSGGIDHPAGFATKLNNDPGFHRPGKRNVA